MKKLLFIISLCIPIGISAQENGEVKSMQKHMINQSTTASYGSSVSSYFSNKVLVGSTNGTNNGEVFIHTLTSTGQVQSTVRITRNVGGFGDNSISGHFFGSAIVNVGDLNGDGIDDIVVGATRAASNKGVLWFLYLDSDGQVIGERILSDTSTGFQSLSNGDYFGSSITNLGDIDGNGYDDIAIGAPYQNNSTSDNGSVFIILLEKFGKIKSVVKISDNNSLFTRSHWLFGQSVTNIGDIDGDGNTDIAVGEPGLNETLWILFLNSNGTLKGVQEIGKDKGGFNDSFNVNSNFGWSVTNLGDMDGDGINDIAVGEIGYINPDSSGTLYGRIWVLLLNSNGTVKKNIPIGNGTGGFTGNIKGGDRFGWSVARIPDLDGDSVPELAVGAPGDKSASLGGGAVYILFLKGVPQLNVPQVAIPAFEVQVFPNPSDSKIKVAINSSTLHQADVQITDVSGKICLSLQNFDLNNEIDVSLLKAGVYFVRLQTSEGVFQSKLIVN